MKLVRNTTKNGTCKYAIVDNRTGETVEARVGSDEEFFVIKLKDKFAEAALRAYAEAAREWDAEYAAEIDELANRSGKNHLLCKTPD